MRTTVRGLALVFVAVAATASACAGTDSTGPDQIVTTSPDQTVTTRKTVPAVVGMDHQTAQDTMQAAGFYNLREYDGSGQNRLLVWDRNWKTIAQDPPAGSVVSTDAEITLTAVKKTD
jgi:hypothetical protein